MDICDPALENPSQHLPGELLETTPGFKVVSNGICGTSRSIDSISTVYDQCMSLNERCLGGTEKENGVSYFVWSPHSPHWCYVDSRLQCFCHLRRRSSHWRLDDARTHTVYSDPISRIIDGICSSHVDDGSFGSTISSYLILSVH